MGDAVRLVLRGVGQTLITIGVVLLLFCVYELKVTNLYTDHEQEQLADDLRERWGPPRAGAVTPVGPPAPVPVAARVPDGAGWGVLRVPRFGPGYVQTVVQGVSVEDLRRGPGHWPDTAEAGQLGNVVLSGHRTTYGAPFGDLAELRVGDALVLETQGAWFTYRMTGSKVVDPSAVEEAYPVPGDARARPTRRLLTLTTCNPKYSARQRLVVRAELEQALGKADGVRPPALQEG